MMSLKAVGSLRGILVDRLSNLFSEKLVFEFFEIGNSLTETIDLNDSQISETFTAICYWHNWSNFHIEKLNRSIATLALSRGNELSGDCGQAGLDEVATFLSCSSMILNLKTAG